MDELPPLIAASALTAMITYPVDFLRAMRMVSAADASAKVIGIAGAARYFTKGLAPELAKGTASRVCKFGGYPIAHRFVQSKLGAKESAGTRALAGAAATIPEIALITPLEVAKLALQLDAVGKKQFANNMFTATRALVRAAGPAALYTGHFALQMRQAVWTSVYFAATPVFLYMMTSRGEGSGSAGSLAVGAAGLAAGVLGALINNPIDVCRSVAQKEALSRWVFDGAAASTKKVVPYVGSTFAACGRVVSQNGVKGLWAGSAFKAMHLGLGGALMAVLQPQCRKIWQQRRRNTRSVAAVEKLRGGALLAGYNPFGLVVTDLGLEFLEYEGSRESDLGKLLSSLKVRKRRSTIKAEWIELVRFSRSAQSTRIYQKLDELLDFLLRAGFIA